MSTPRQKNLAVLGSTGSIGVNSLDVAARFPERFRVAGLAAGRNMKLLAKQAEAFKPRMVAVKGEEEAAEFKALAGAGAKYEIVFGEEGLIRLAAMESVDIVVSALVGAVGLAPTWAAVSAGKRVALANKETLVMAGELVMAKAKDTGAEILPVDSEHSAVFQVLSGQRRQDLKRIILTASGGPFRETGAKELAAVTKDQALNHPNWNMGAKISVDSATLMNKGLEAIEARWLFDLPWDLIDIQIHPQSIIHSMIELVDGSVLAQLGVPDMKIPIAYALSYPERLPLDLPGLDLPKAGALTFTEPDNERFPGLSLALAAGRQGGIAPAVLNAANEIAVEAFLAGDINFPGIIEVVAQTLDGFGNGQPSGRLDSLETVRQADLQARTRARGFINDIKRNEPKW